MAGEDGSQVNYSWQDLPDDCWEEIFSHLQFEEEEPLTLVCKRFLAISNRTCDLFTFPNPKFTPSTVPPLMYSRFPNITRVELDKPHPYLARFLEDLAASSLPLKYLSLSRQSHFPRKAMRGLGNRMHKTLRSLTFTGFRRMTQDDLLIIANYFSYLSHLNVANSCSSTPKSMITDDILKEISTKIISLVSLSVTCPYNDDSPSGQSFQYLSSRRPLLSDLQVSFDGRFPGELLWFVSFKSLTSLNLHSVNISDTALVYLSRAKLKLLSLTLVSLESCEVNGSLMCVFLESLSFLTYLYLFGYNFGSHPIDFDLAASMPNCIQFVSLAGCEHLPNATFSDILKRHQKLQTLTFDLDNSVPIVDSLFHPPLHQGLKILSLSGASLSHQVVKLICSSCPMLEYFTITESPLITKEGVEEIIAGCSNLNFFSVSEGFDSVLDYSLYRDKPSDVDHSK